MFKRILVPLDGSSLAECVLPHVVALAEAYEPEVTLTRVLECEPSTGLQFVDPLDWELCKAEAEAYLTSITNRLSDVGLETQASLLEGRPAERIVEYAQGNEIDLIVLSSHGRAGLSRWNVNSIVRKVVQHGKRSSMIVRAYRTPPTSLGEMSYSRLLVPLDGSSRAECVLSTAATLTRRYNAHLILTHVISRPTMPLRMPHSDEDEQLITRFVERSQELADEYMEQLRLRMSVPFDSRVVVSDDVSARLHQLVDDQEIDLVLMSAHGRSGQTRWPFGSVTTSFIEYGTTPLLIVQDLPPHEVEITEAEAAAQELKGH
jgi:nucleotide-binding universal stress UspA family protein